MLFVKGSQSGDDFYEEFTHHADRMYQVASLVADSSNNIDCKLFCCCIHVCT